MSTNRMRAVTAVAVLVALCVGAAMARPSCVNGLVYDDRHQCECFTCWSGPACDVEVSQCLLSCETNEGYVQTDYWTGVANGDPHTDVASSYRTDYQDPQVWHPGMPDPPPGVFGAIREQALRVHDMVGNVANIRNKSMIVAHGATQLINAAIDAYSRSKNRYLEVVAVRPYYYLVPGVATVAKGARGFLPADDVEDDDVDGLVEVITSPRNPDGAKGLNASTGATSLIYDNVFYWPSFTDMDGPLDLPLSIFSLSKLSGLSGSRLGWAFVEDPDLADLMGQYIYYSTHGITTDAQFRASHVLQNIADNGGALFDYVRSTLTQRWAWLESAFHAQTEVHYEISGAFGFPVVWINCLDFPDKDGCSVVFAMYGINVRSGGEFGMPGYVRMNMMVHAVTWTQVQDRISGLLSASTPHRLRALELAHAKKVVYPKYSS